MDLKNFIIDTVSEIINAVKELQTKYSTPEVLINPDKVFGEKGGFWIGEHSKNNISKRRVQEIKIRASLEITDSETTGRGVGISITSLNLGRKKENNQNEAENSCVEFDLPIALPTVPISD